MMISAAGGKRRRQLLLPAAKGIISAAADCKSWCLLHPSNNFAK
jgi:hypothetical protein